MEKATEETELPEEPEAPAIPGPEAAGGPLVPPLARPMEGPPGYYDSGLRRSPGMGSPGPNVRDLPHFRCAIELTPDVRKAVADCFEHYAWAPEHSAKGETVRAGLRNAVEIIIELVPPCPNRSSAIRKTREAWMDCNSAITHEGRY